MSNLLYRSPESGEPFTTLIDLLRTRAVEHGARVAFFFLDNGETEGDSVTYQQLDQQARAIATHLQRIVASGHKALLLYPSGLDYVRAFLGCLYAGTVAVPCYLPRPNRPMPRLQAIVGDAQPEIVLTTRGIAANQERWYQQIPQLASLPWVCTEEIETTEADHWQVPALSGDSLAFLQYTSGSTAAPRGVMLTHANLLHNSELIHQAFETNSHSRAVFWLPLYHDMGLIGGVLQPLYCGGTAQLFAPLAFLQRPLRWLHAISRTQANVSGGPNFAYDLCLQKVTPEDLETLDLRSWHLAFTGAEPVRADTLMRFAEVFGPCGFRWQAFYPCYGLAEGTLIVSGGQASTPPVLHSVAEEPLRQQRVVLKKVDAPGTRRLVSSGQVVGDQQLLIVDPDTLQPCPGDRIGEVLVAGPSVARGYWNQPEKTAHTFKAIPVGASTPYLRTGDLGFLHDGELFITGRLKDLIIIRGRNHFPEDIEWTATQSHPLLEARPCAAFSAEVEGEERLCIVQEVQARRASDLEAPPEDIVEAIRRAVVEQHEVEVYAILLLANRTIPRTSSGKIQRYASREGFLEGSLSVVYSWTARSQEAEASRPCEGVKALLRPPHSTQAIQRWLIEHLGERLGIEADAVDVRRPFAHYGLSSVQAVSLSAELEDWLGVQLSPTLAYTHPTIEALATHLAQEAPDPRVDVPAKKQTEAVPLAVIGMGCRFPGGGNDPETYWRLLRDGVDTVTEIPADRWDLDTYYDPDPDRPGKTYSRWGAFVDGVDAFDGPFFNIAPREAMTIDPQQRFLLEAAWEAVEDAGIAAPTLVGSRTGVFVGISTTDYLRLLDHTADPRVVDGYMATGSSKSVAAGRLSYFFGLQGPCLALDTACSSSLVALHLASQSLLGKECDLALAGGVNLVLSPMVTVAFSKARMLSPEGRCKTFSESANGFVRAEGCGVVLLKRLDDALRDGDRVLALILGSAINQDGASNGLTAPSELAQEAVIREALAGAHVQPSQVSYLEAHGTGTALGDPIEMRALQSVFAPGRDPGKPLLVGSVKTNVGHMEPAAGIASFIKVVQSLKHNEIPPHLHLDEPNHLIPWESWPVRVPTERTPWPTAAGQRIAGISSFGFSGTNAHVVVAGAPVFKTASSAQDRPLHVLTLSARKPEALPLLAEHLDQHLAHNPLPLPDVCYTANTGRSHFEHRLALVTGSVEELREQLRAFSQGRQAKRLMQGTSKASARPEVAFLFTGQGAQRIGMGQRLYETEPVFRQTLDQCADILRPHLDRPLLEVLYPTEGEHSPLSETAYTQPGLFAFEYALAQTWLAYGLKPAALLGHSVGEYVAACVAGVFSLEDGLALIAARGRLMQALPANGEMVVAFTDVERVARVLESHRDLVSIAAMNGPENVVFSGERTAVQQVQATLEAEGVRCQPLVASHAFHSPLMEPMRDPFEQVARRVAYHPPQLPLISNVTGKLARPDEVNSPTYWRKHVRAPVRFAAGMQALAAAGPRLFLELGPHPTLLGMAKRCLPDLPATWLPSLRDSRDDLAQMLETLATLYVHGVPIDWAGFDRPYLRHRVALPTYPFQRERCWSPAVEMGKQKNLATARGSDTQGPPLLGRRLRSPRLQDTVFECTLAEKSPTLLQDHRVHQAVVLPGAAYVEMALASAAVTLGSENRLERLHILEPMILAADQARVVQVILTAQENGTDIEVFSRTDDSEGEPAWAQHARGTLVPAPKGEPPLPEVRSWEEGLAHCPEAVNTEEFYRLLAERGLEYGPSFRCVEAVHRGDGQAIGKLRTPKEGQHGDHYHLHPCVLDAAFQVLGAAFPAEWTDEMFVPVGIEAVQLHARPSTDLWCYTRLHPPGEGKADRVTGDVWLFAGPGQLITEVRGLSLRRLPEEMLRRFTSQRSGDWLHELKWIKQRHAGARLAGSDPGRWLIFADRGGVGDQLAQLLTAQGHDTRLIRRGPETMGSNSVVSLDPSSGPAFRQILEPTLAREDLPCKGILYLWGLDANFQEDQASALEEAMTSCCQGVLHLLQALGQSRSTAPPSLTLVTRGTQVVGPASVAVVPGASPLWGLGRVIALEHAELRCLRVDLDELASEQEAGQLLQEILYRDDEDQVAFRDGIRHVARLTRVDPTRISAVASADQPHQLQISSRGSLGNLRFRPVARPALGRGEVLLRVQATGLNFRDVLNTLGMYPGDPGPLGGECAGIIEEVGAGVEGLGVGAEVFGLAPASFGTYARTLAEFVVAKPAQLSFEQAASIPIAFITAHYALRHVGQIQAGERLLIHSASGGVGLAAIQVARLAGAKVLATAGNPAKRQYLAGLGIENVFGSRTLDFADQVRATTQGAGVHLVLNSLRDEFIPRSLELLCPGGRFLEIGKTDLWTPQRVAEVNPGASYSVIALDHLMADEPALVGKLLREVVEQFRSGAFQPLPCRTFAIHEAEDAFRFMAQTKHIGKIVLTQPDPGGAEGLAIQSEGSYLITGGLGGLGLLTARRLVERGARHLLLLSRREPSPAAKKKVEELENQGAQIRICSVDVGKEKELARALEEAAIVLPPLRGVIHAAGVLEDGILLSQTWEQFQRVLGPKVAGAWNLHRLTRNQPLDFFVCYSSMASLLGSPGQGNYAAANAFLDSLAHYRRALGLPALTINWGPWEQVGMAANAPGLSRRTGIDSIPPDQGLDFLERLLSARVTQAAVLPIHWPRFLQQYPALPTWARELTTPGQKQQAPAADVPRGEFLKTLEAAAPGVRHDLLLSFLQEKTATVLGLSAEEAIDPARPLREMGFDSLMVVEMRNTMEVALDRSFPPILFFDYPTLEAITTHLLGEMFPEQSTPAAPATVPADRAEAEAGSAELASLVDRIAGLSEEQLDSLLGEQDQQPLLDHEKP